MCRGTSCPHVPKGVLSWTGAWAYFRMVAELPKTGGVGGLQRLSVAEKREIKTAKLVCTACPLNCDSASVYHPTTPEGVIALMSGRRFPLLSSSCQTLP